MVLNSTYSRCYITARTYLRALKGIVILEIDVHNEFSTFVGCVFLKENESRDKYRTNNGSVPDEEVVALDVD